MACMPRHHLPRFDKSSGLDTRLASGLCAGRAQSTYCMVQRYWLMSLAPTNEESAWLNEEKIFNRIKMTSQLSTNDVFHVQLVWIQTTKCKSLLRVENSKGLNFLLL